MSAEGLNEVAASNTVQRGRHGPGGPQHQVRRKNSEWEILGNLDKGATYSIRPKKKEGFMSKRRKWPLKGWHKRFFVLENGLLTYGKTPHDLNRGRTHGRIDVGAAVVSAKPELLRIDIDDEECIHHFKLNSAENFGLWLEQLKQHRLYSQHNLNSDTSPLSPQDEFPGASPRNSLPRNLRGLPPSGGASSKMLQELHNLDENMTSKLLNVQQQAVALAMLAQKVEDEQNATSTGGQTLAKHKKLFGLRKKKSAGKTASQVSNESRSSTLTSERQSLNVGEDNLDTLSTHSTSTTSTLANMASLSSSNPTLNQQDTISIQSATSGTSSMASGAARPISLPSDGTVQSFMLKPNNKSPAGPTLSSSLSNNSSLAASSGIGSLTQQHSNSSTASTTSTLAALEISNQTREEMLILAQDIQSDVSELLRSFTADRDKLKTQIESAAYELSMTKSATLGAVSNNSGNSSGNVAIIASLRQSLNQAMQQNSMLKAKLNKIHLDSDIGDLQAVAPTPQTDTLTRGMNHSLSYSSSCISEFFDAREYASDADPDSEYNSSDEDESTGSDAGSTSDDDQLYEEANLLPPMMGGSADNLLGGGATNPALHGNSLSSLLTAGAIAASSSSNQGSNPGSNAASQGQLVASTSSNLTSMVGRRQKLPVPKTDTEGINLWNLLCKNIGKDLSKISMPVTLNEPLSALQRLCEELEYSELLDKAASATESDIDRMTWVAAFAVSIYGSCQARAGHKPFNPLLGETFECLREDRGFRYVAEQVSHHPPVSACHASSLDNEKWVWTQDLRVKTKFWGKSMEFQPEGLVSLKLKVGDEIETYEWNKITTCIHNLFGGSDRWVDLYGECVIKSKNLTCKIDFVKASYWSNKKHEIYGTISDKNGKVVQHLFGKWSEALYCGKAPSAKCIWRPAMLPADSAIYYGFSRFAMELNEVLDLERNLLPRTDTRFRPDQRLLEEGQINDAENMKLKLEQNQRERRRQMEERGESHQPNWFRKSSGDGGIVDGDSAASSTGGRADWEFNHQYWDRRSAGDLGKASLLELW